MRTLTVSGYALSISLAAALLSACGGSSMPMRASDSDASNAGAPPGSKTFKYTGKKQTFVVPAGVRRLTVVARGAEGGGFAYYPSSDSPGRGGRVYAIIPVHPGEKLYVFVGGSGTHGGFNGGGAGGASGYGKYKKIPGYPGGGASDVRKGGDALQNRIIVAAGGGGTGEAFYYYGYGYGGSGGGLAGESGGGEDSYYDGAGGAGATQTAGGSGGAGGQYYQSFGSYGQGQPGGNGALGLGGSGGNGSGSCDTGGGGGGGGGYYGAGGGGGGAYTYLSRYSCYPRAQGGGGGGGSSYVEPSAITSRMWTGWKKAEGDGLVVFSWN